MDAISNEYHTHKVWQSLLNIVILQMRMSRER